MRVSHYIWLGCLIAHYSRAVSNQKKDTENTAGTTESKKGSDVSFDNHSDILEIFFLPKWLIETHVKRRRAKAKAAVKSESSLSNGDTTSQSSNESEDSSDEDDGTDFRSPNVATE